MKRQYLAICSIVGLALMASQPAKASAIIINFSVFPGADNTLGTGDDVPVPLSASSSGGSQTRFTNEFAFLSGGIGFVVNSLCCTGSTGNELGAIANVDGQNLLVQARPDIDSTAYSLSSFEIDFVSALDGITPVIVHSVDLRFIAGSTGTVDFINGRNGLRFRSGVPQNGSENILYSDDDGLARIVFNGTGAANLFEFDATQALTAPPPVPEPASLSLMALGALMLATMPLLRGRKS